MKRMMKLREEKDRFLSKIKDRCDIRQAIEHLKTNSSVKFDESVDLAIRLGIDPKKTNENVRTSMSLPHGVPNKKRIAVFTNSEIKEADRYGLQELIADIKSGKIEYDTYLCESKVFSMITSIAPILGKMGKMPNSKDGTVTTDVQEAIRQIRGGNRVTLRNDSAGYVQVRIGKLSFTEDQLVENTRTIVSWLRANIKTKKEAVISVFLSSTMGSGFEIKI